jgi:hypothetical protein
MSQIIETIETNVNNPLETLTKATKAQSKRTLDRRKENASVRAALLNFTDVFKYVRKEYLCLPNRVNQKHINECNVFIKDMLLIYCSEHLAEKAKETFYLDRLPILVTDIKALKCFMTVKQLETFGEKAWQFSNIMDIIVKALTMNTKNYAACLEMRSKM